jgi:hypothetical protein
MLTDKKVKHFTSFTVGGKGFSFCQGPDRLGGSPGQPPEK